MHAPQPDRSFRLGIGALVLLGLAFHLPRLCRPLGTVDACAGAFFGVFFRNYDAYGFAELRGMALWRQLFPSPLMAEPYLTHPPGLWWTMYALGGAEWAMRLPSVLGAIGGSVALACLLRRSLGTWPALVAGALLLGTPVMAVYCQASYEPVAIGMGLALWVVTLRANENRGGRRAAWTALQAVLAFAGTWLDWSFVMFCFGLVPLAYDRALRTWALRLAIPALASVAAAVTVVMWQKWALASPLVTPPAESGAFFDQAARTIGAWPGVATLAEKALHWLWCCAGLMLLVAALPGTIPLFRTAPRPAIALFVTGAAHALLFAGHAVTHPHFWCLSMPFVASAAAAIGAAPIGRAPRIVTSGIVLVMTWVAAIALDRLTDSPFQRDVGRVLSDAADLRDASGAPTGAKLDVATNYWPIWAAYVDEPTAYVAAPLLDVAALESVRKDRAFRYVWLVVEKPPGIAHNDRIPALEAFLGRFPRRAVPELVGARVVDPGFGWDWRVVEAWVVDVPRAP